MDSRTRVNHEIDYKIYGEELQYVELELDPNETAIAESGAMMMMEDGIEMQTIFGDGSAQQSTGLLGKLMSAGKRLLVGESLFMTAFTNVGQGKKKVSFAAPYTGKIIAMDLQQLGGGIIAQKDAFLCAAKGVSVGIHFNGNWEQGFLEERASSWKKWKETVWLLCMQVDMYWRKS
jgi:uncharacterized protein (AIM24 family)